MIPNSRAIEITLHSKFEDNPAKLLTLKQIRTLAKILIIEAQKIVKNAPSCFYVSSKNQSFVSLEMRLAYLNLLGVDIKITKGVEITIPNVEDLLSEALNHKTSSLRLQEIFITYYLYLSEQDKLKDNDKIPLAIVSNPNTFFDILCKLAINYPEEFLQNSIVDVHRQINPNLLQEIPEATLYSLIKTKNIPMSWINFLLHNRRSISLVVLIKKYYTQLWKKWRKENPHIRIGQRE